MKDKKISKRKVLSNNLFMVKVLWKAAPIYTIMLILEVIRHNGMVFFEHTYGVNYVLESVEFKRPFHDVIRFLILLTILIALSAIYTNIFSCYVSIKYLPKIKERLKILLYEKARSIDLACYDDPDYYNEFVLAVSESEKSIDRTIQLLKMLFSGLTLFLSYGIFFLTKDVISILFVFTTYILRFVFMGMYNKLKFSIRLKEIPLERKRSYVQRVFYLNEYAKELRVNKEASVQLHKKFDDVNGELLKLQKDTARQRFTLKLLANYLSTDFVMDVLYISYLVFKAAVMRTISYSSVVVLYNSAGDLRHGLSTLTDLIPQAQELSLYVEKIRTFLTYETKLKEGKKLPVPKESKTYCLNKVSFAYKGQNDNILNELNMKIEPYQKIALVGYNGAGKTTLTKLLMRLYDTKEGTITFDGVNIMEYDVEAYRNNIGAVFQDYRLYAATVQENVVMDQAKKENEEKVIEALNQSGFKQRLETLSEGIHTPLTREFEENGVDLSGGESQKLAVARGFFKDTNLIILDEPSSALDPIAEYNLNQFMFEAAKDKTVIFISHRLSTTRKADKIYMLEKGRIIEEGSHDELLKKDGKYAAMWKAQAGKYAGSLQ